MFHIIQEYIIYNVCLLLFFILTVWEVLRLKWNFANDAVYFILTLTPRVSDLLLRLNINIDMISDLHMCLVSLL